MAIQKNSTVKSSELLLWFV